MTDGWVLITGAAKHLGAAIAIELAHEGHDLVIQTRHSEQEAEQLASTCRALGVRAEVFLADLEESNDFIRRYGCRKTKGIVHNVGNYLLGPPSRIQDDLQKLLQVNLLAPIAITQALLPMIQRVSGTIVTIGVAGLGGPWVGAAAYGLTKEGLLSYTRSLAKELAPDGVTVNMVSPGYLENSMHVPSIPPMGRLGTHAEVAALVAHLFSDRGRYITGQNIEVAGGWCQN